jgi:hypothetical protein
MVGAGSDLQIYHDGNNKLVTSGDLLVNIPDGDEFQVLGSQTASLRATATGSVRLFYNGADKLTTTSTGIDVTGTVTADGLTVNSGTNNTVAKFESSDAGAFIILEDSGSTNDGNRIAVEGNVMSFATGDSERLRIDSSGNVNIGTTGATNKLVVKRDSTTAATNAQIVSENGSN